LKVLGKIGFVWFAILFAGFFLLTYPLFFLLLSHKSLYPAANFLRKIWAWFALILGFSFPYYTYESKESIKRPAVYVSNHTSYLDIVFFGIFAPLKTSFMGKIELARIPLFGRFFRTVDIGVNRANARDAHKAFQTSTEKLRDGYSILMFPEGTIWNKTPLLKPFKNGAFKLAIENKVPIIPVTFYNNYKVLPDEKFEYYPGILKCRIHRAILTDNLNTDDADKLRDDIYHIIQNELIQNKIIHEDNR